MPELRVASVIALWYIGASASTLFVMWRDRRAAQRGRWRTAESTLHTLELLGGWPGTLLGQRMLRHKTRKMSYRLVLALIIALHAAVWVTAILLWL